MHGYEEWGEELPAHLHGMFAFAVWDTSRERLLLARDRIGKKPLYIRVREDGLIFQFYIRAVILASEDEPELDQEYVASFLFQRYVSGAKNTCARGGKDTARTSRRVRQRSGPSRNLLAARRRRRQT